MDEPGRIIRNDLAFELSRREFMQRAGALGAAAAVVSALPLLEKLAVPERAKADVVITDGTMQAFYDTIIPGRPATKTDLGNDIHPKAIAGVDGEPGAVEADALLLGHHPKIGFDALEPAFLAELETRSLAHGGDFLLTLDYEGRQAVCIGGLAYNNPSRVLWEAAAAVPFTAFCAAATQVNATSATASGLRVMDHPGIAPHGYKNFSFGRKLNRGRTRKGYLA
jgi:hypothetical protein